MKRFFRRMKRFFRRLRFWLFQRGKHCKHCCLFCGFYDICSMDFVNDLAKAFNRFDTAAANAGASIKRLSEAAAAATKESSGINSRRP